MSNHLPQLDGLRAFAVGLVVLHHLTYRAFPGGSIGVDIFFVLSGYLITGVLLRERANTSRISLSAFYMRRLLRLMPALLLMVALVSAFELAFGAPEPNPIASSVLAATYLMDFVRSLTSFSELSLVGHTWSLAVEEHFYLIWPLLLGAILTLPARWRASPVLFFVVLLAAWRSWLIFSGAPPDRTYYAFDMRSDQLLLGCAAALWASRSPLSAARIGSLWPLAGLGILATAILGDRSSASALLGSAMPVLIAAMSAVLVLDLALNSQSRLSRFAGAAPLAYIGAISYGIYLWHYPMLIGARFYVGSNKFVAVFSIAASIVAAALSYRYVETPFLRAKKRFERGGTGLLPSATPSLESENLQGVAATPPA